MVGAGFQRDIESALPEELPVGNGIHGMDFSMGTPEFAMETLTDDPPPVNDHTPHHRIGGHGACSRRSQPQAPLHEFFVMRHSGQNHNFAKNNTMQATIQYIRNELAEFYPATEITEFTRLIFHALRGWSLTGMVLHSGETLTHGEMVRVRNIVERLKKSEPIQYILGSSCFYGLTLEVTPAVLIPRPETEELVDWIVTGRKVPPSSLLDVGTGSGCIALALAKAFPECTAEGCDISEDALAVAMRNGRNTGSRVRFFQADILRWQEFPGWEKRDLIISNPPYVTISEKNEMEENVVGFEPGGALFVPDEDPLLYYRAIAAFASHWLVDGGELFLEINRRFGEETARLLADKGFRETEIRSDFRGNTRMVKTRK